MPTLKAAAFTEEASEGASLATSMTRVWKTGTIAKPAAPSTKTMIAAGTAYGAARAKTTSAAVAAVMVP
ncbi:hypothetical protein ADL26_11700 [Thermoactinomyces vulgaris]|nr:hypothetical protein ADL26_11700 [Thermoactinomyces vulgaris]